MTQPPAHSPHAAQDIAAVLGGMLCALLAALLGLVRFGGVGARAARPDGYNGVMAGVLRAAADADFEAEPEVEWIAVPAPWRAGQGALRSCGRATDAPPPGTMPAARGPPWGHTMFEALPTGIA